jgi:hypothetical protein
MTAALPEIAVRVAAMRAWSFVTASTRSSAMSTSSSKRRLAIGSQSTSKSWASPRTTSTSQ